MGVDSSYEANYIGEVLVLLAQVLYQATKNSITRPSIVISKVTGFLDLFKPIEP